MASGGNRGTIKDFPGFKASDDVQKLKAAMRGAGTDENAIAEILANRSNSQRQKIKLEYKSSVGKDLIDDLKSELSGNFKKVIVGLMMTAPEYDAYELREAMKGAATDEGCLIEILASHSNQEIRTIVATYKKNYDKSLEDDIVSDTSYMFQRVLVSLATANRDEGTTVNEELAKQDAQLLFSAGSKSYGTSEQKFNTCLCTNCGLTVFEEYKKVSNKDLEASIKSEMSGNLEDALLAIVKCTKNKPAYFAERLYKSMKGLGTTDSILIRVMVSRCEVDMLDIRSEFKKNYGKSLHSFIKGDTSGDYRNVLLKLCGGED
nr:PREDICTED: annexin A4 [Latimeria chalumnae]|eukprot:XP_005988281.1 PREDICTED: annexin A4 [Latimeria chalumnae]